MPNTFPSLTRSELIAEAQGIYLRDDMTDTNWAQLLDEAQMEAARRHSWQALYGIFKYEGQANTRAFSLDYRTRTVYGGIRMLTDGTPNTSFTLEYIPQDRFFNRYEHEQATPTGKPLDYTRYGRFILLGPTPDIVYKFEMTESRWPTSFRKGDPETTCDIPYIDDFLYNRVASLAFARRGLLDLAVLPGRIADEKLKEAIKNDNRLWGVRRVQQPEGYEL